jgi:hypothetical protein
MTNRGSIATFVPDPLLCKTCMHALRVACWNGIQWVRTHQHPLQARELRTRDRNPSNTLIPHET